MPITVESIKMTYFPAPKVACTSLKLLCYRLNHGHDFKEHSAGGRQVHIHNHSSDYATSSFLDADQSGLVGYRKLAVVRDPAERLLSAYTNRVVNLRELAVDRIDTTVASALELTADPTPEQFFRNIEGYRLLSPSVRHHTDPLTFFLGPDIAYFARVYRIENLGELIADLQRETGEDIHLPHEQRSGNRLKWQDINSASKRAILEFSFGDYALLSSLYAMPAIR